MRILVSDATWAMAITGTQLREQGFLVSEAGDGAELLEFALQGQHDAVLIDPDLPDMNYASLVRDLRAACPRLPVLLLARRWSDSERSRAWHVGADAVLESPLPTAELAARLRAFARRAQGYAAGVIQPAAGLSLDLDARRAVYDGRTLQLTRLEYELVEMLALRGGALVGRDEIMTQLYAWDNEPEAKILDVYMCRIRAKLATLGAPGDLIVTNFAQGFRLNLLAPGPLSRAA